MTQTSLPALVCLQQIAAALERAGQPLTATRLKRTFGFGDDVFTEAVTYGHDEKIIHWEKGNIFSFVSQFSIPEEAYYPTIGDTLSALWHSEKHDRSQYYIENTSRRNSKIAGPWTRPDFTLVSYKKFPWTIGHEFDVVTFEVKKAETCNVLAVFEALSHVSVATRAYVVFPLDEPAWVNADPAQAKRVREECVRHGVGLILIGDIGTQPKPTHLIRAQRKEIDHERCSSFLAAVVSEEGKNRIAEWK